MRPLQGTRSTAKPPVAKKEKKEKPMIIVATRHKEEKKEKPTIIVTTGHKEEKPPVAKKKIKRRHGLKIKRRHGLSPADIRALQSEEGLAL